MDDCEKNAQNRTESKQHNRGEWGNRTSQGDTQIRGLEVQNSTFNQGIELRDPMEEIIAINSGNLEQEDENRKRKNGERQEVVSAITKMQQRNISSVRHETSAKMMKSKRIMERFVKPKEGVENKSSVTESQYSRDF